MAAAGVPIAREPSTDATPQVAGCIVRTQPSFDALKAEPANRQRVVDIECSGDVSVRPCSRMGRRNIGAFYLKDSDAFAAVESKLGFVLAVAVALEVLSPGRLGVGLGPHVVLVEAPFAGAPSKDLVGGAGKVSVDSCFDARIPFADVGARQLTADAIVLGRVGRNRLPRIVCTTYPPGALVARGEVGAGGKSLKLGGVALEQTGAEFEAHAIEVVERRSLVATC